MAPRVMDTDAAVLPPVPFVLFVGPTGDGPMERLVDGARVAAAIDLLTRARDSGVFAPLLMVTPDGCPVEGLPAGIEVVPTPRQAGASFHFGRALHSLAHERRLSVVLACGAGAGPLLREAGLRGLARPLRTAGVAVVANNLYSADLVGVRPASALDRDDLPAEDNGLAFVLWRNAGLPGYEPPRTAATQFDIDSPTDLLIAALHPAIGPCLKAQLRVAGLDVARLQTAVRVFSDPLGQALVAGRIGSHAMAYLERETACRVRVFAEERGMRALGLEGRARSLLGMHLEAVGPDAFMSHLAELADAVFIDTRVLLAHARSDASREDRFLSDLGRWREIDDSFLREFTRAACEAPIPIILGGQSLVSGGMMALVEAGWARTDGERTAADGNDDREGGAR